MTTSNLPPGVTESMIPGNRPEDIAWEKLHNDIDKDAEKARMSDVDASVAWQLGLDLWKRLKKMNVRFVHEAPEPEDKPTPQCRSCGSNDVGTVEETR